VSPQFRIEAAVEPPKSGSNWVEIASHQAGQAGSIWRTDVVARNLSEADADVEIRLRGAGGGTLTATIAGGAQAAFEDVLGQMGVDGKGWLEITRTARSSCPGGSTTSATRAPSGSTWRATRQARAGPGVVGTLLQLRQLEGEFRTNLGFTNPNETAAAVQVTLYDAGGPS